MLRKVKVLHVFNDPFVIPYYLGDQIGYFSNRGYEIHITSNGPYQNNNFDFHYFETEIIRKYSLWKDFLAVIKLYSYIKDKNIDIVVGHTPKGALIAMVASYLNKIEKRIYFRHGLLFETSTGFERCLLVFIERITGFLSTKVINVSNSVMIKSNAFNLNKPEKNIILHNGSCNGINIEKFSPTTIPKERNIEFLNKIVVGFVGRVVKDKGVIELLDAWKLLLNKYNNIELVIVGPTETRNSIPNGYLNYINDEKSINYIGYVANTLTYFRTFDIFVLPSYREGLPTVVLEASCLGLPVITTKSTGCIDSIIEGVTGLYCDLNANDIALKIERYIVDKNLRISHGKAGHEFVKFNFKQTIIWEEIEKKAFEM